MPSVTSAGDVPVCPAPEMQKSIATTTAITPTLLRKRASGVVRSKRGSQVSCTLRSPDEITELRANRIKAQSPPARCRMQLHARNQKYRVIGVLSQRLIRVYLNHRSIFICEGDHSRSF